VGHAPRYRRPCAVHHRDLARLRARCSEIHCDADDAGAAASDGTQTAEHVGHALRGVGIGIAGVGPRRRLRARDLSIGLREHLHARRAPHARLLTATQSWARATEQCIDAIDVGAAEDLRRVDAHARVRAGDARRLAWRLHLVWLGHDMVGVGRLPPGRILPRRGRVGSSSLGSSACCASSGLGGGAAKPGGGWPVPRPTATGALGAAG